jgi:hypothetical protein
MGADLPKRIVRRLLHGVGLATAGDVVRARQAAAARVKSDARSTRNREQASTAATVQALQAQLESRHEQDVANLAERSTLRKALAFHWERLNHLEPLFGAHVERLRLQLEVAVAVRPEEPAPEWPDGAAAEDAPRVKVGGVEWCLPPLEETGMPAKPSLERCLPLDDLAASRQFAVGGVMLDIDAGFGQTSIPRALLGDFHRIHAAEGRDAWYRCLAANVTASRVRGVVRPDHLSIGPSDLDAWLARLQVPAGEIRFVRVGASTAGLEILREGVRLLSRRDVVWQLDLDPTSPLVTQDGFAPLAGVIRTHFTHFKELGRYPSEPWRKAAEAKRLFKRADGPKPSGLLLFNLE